MNQNLNATRALRHWLSGIALAAAAWPAVAITYSSDEGKLLQGVDYPNGTLFGMALGSGRLQEVWKNAAPLNERPFEFASDPRDRSRTVHLFLSAPTLLPAAALKAMSYNSSRATPEGPNAWRSYWMISRVEPAPGASTRRMYASAKRRMVLCERGELLDAGSLYFASLDASGTPYRSDIVYEKPPTRDFRQVPAGSALQKELREVCGPILTAAFGEEESARRLEKLFAAPTLTPEQILRMRELAAKIAALGGTPDEVARYAPPEALPQPASAAASDIVPTPPSPAASAAQPEAPKPLGSTKARVRIFAQNGIGSGLTNEAACQSRDSDDATGSGLSKAFGSLIGRVDSERIGMPESTSTAVMPGSGVTGATPYFVEREITAEMPVTVNFNFAGAAAGYTCPTMRASWIPEAGGDYEASMQPNSRYCLVQIKRILPDGQLRSEPVTPVPSCPPEPSR